MKSKGRIAVADRLVVRAHVKELADISQFVTTWARTVGFDEESIQDIDLATTELCTNIIQHGYSRDDLGTIEVRCEDEGEQGSITIADRASPFDPRNWLSAQSPRQLSEARTGGRGLAIVHRLVDSLEYEENPGGGNRVRMIKRK